MKALLIFITKHLLTIHTGTMFMKMKSSVILGASFSPVAFGLAQMKDWIAINFNMMTLIAIAIIVDHLVGTYLHAFVRRDFTWKENANGFFTKTFLCICAFILFEGMNFILKDATFVEAYFKIVTSLTVFIYPAGSALTNMSEITGGKFPPIGWMEKIQSFNKNLKIKPIINEASKNSTFPDRD